MIKNKRLKYLLIFNSFVTVLLVVGLVIYIARNNGAAPIDADNDALAIDSGDFAVVRECLLLDWDQMTSCLDNLVEDYVAENEQTTTAELLLELENAGNYDNIIKESCHPVTHAIGRWALQSYDGVQEALSSCDFTCGSGCFHGVVERVFFEDEEIASGSKHVSVQRIKDKLDSLCVNEQDKNTFEGPQLQCVHGAGHAIMYTVDYDTALALSLCDEFDDLPKREICYSGVFMENMLAFDRSKRDIDSNDLHHPCNKVDHKYQRQCYFIQTTLWFDMEIPSAEMVELCTGATFQEACFFSLGRDVSLSFEKGVVDPILEICVDLARRYGFMDSCVEGVAHTLITTSNTGGLPHQFCELLSKDMANCYSIVNNYYSAGLGYESDELIESCKLHAKNTEICINSI